MLEDGFSSFDSLNDQYIKRLVDDRPELFETSVVMSALNRLIDFHEELPFNINFSHLNAKKLNVILKEKKQHLVIPPRLYSEMINSFSKDIQSLIKFKPQIELEVERMYQLEQSLMQYRIELFRNGKIAEKNMFKSGFEELKNHFNDQNIVLVDGLETEEENPGLWIKTFMEIRPTVNLNTAYFLYMENWKFTPFIIGELSFDTIGQFKSFLAELDMKCKMLCLLLSLSRIDELNAMHPEYGAQSYEYNGQKIYILTTRQSKIKSGVQTKEDIFATTKTGYDAFNLMCSIHRPLLKKIDTNNKHFVSLSQTQYPKALGKKSWADTFRVAINRWLKNNTDIILTAEDISFLRVSNPGNTDVNIGNPFHFTNHQTRRSSAFYLVGYELLAFPQLQQQLSHLSRAMSRHYANNASYWGTLRKEVDDERNTQKSELLATVYKRIANNERIAGGKAKALKSLTGNTDYFEEADNSRLTSAKYWKKMLETGKSHIHAIAPGMYCTNSNCDMRINIVLEECVGCEFDVILEGMYAEGKRVNASKNLALLDSFDELTHSVASQLIIQIKSCEAILSDLEISFEPTKIPQHILNMLIEVKTS